MIHFLHDRCPCGTCFARDIIWDHLRLYRNLCIFRLSFRKCVPALSVQKGAVTVPMRSRQVKMCPRLSGLRNVGSLAQSCLELNLHVRHYGPKEILVAASASNSRRFFLSQTRFPCRHQRQKKFGNYFNLVWNNLFFM
ncbi:unnamed protein product [Ixodes pacificus]